jgi:hypothetical protein
MIDAGLMGAVVIFIIGLGLVFGLHQSRWTCPRCGSKRDIFETPWLDERGMSCQRCWEVR